MDDRTRAATYQDVRRVAELLEEEHVEYALIGGYALALQGIVRLTEDVDILVEPTLENTRRWVRALSRLPDGAAKELAGDDTLHEELYAIRINGRGRSVQESGVGAKAPGTGCEGVAMLR
jgi:hypothetical protein